MSVLTLAEAKTHLGITGSTYDTELQDFIDSAEAAIGEWVGPLASASVTCRVVANGDRLVLPQIPVVSLTSVTPADDAAVTVADLYVDSASGVVTYNDGGSFGARYYTVVYSAGRSACPDDLLMAVKEQVRALWEDSQRGDADRLDGEQYMSNTIAGSQYGLSYEVSRMIAPHIQPGFA